LAFDRLRETRVGLSEVAAARFVVATYLPARGVARVNPIVALRRD
jgi:hypothetical protein